MKAYRVVLVTVVAMLLPATALAAGSVKLDGKYTGHFPGGIGLVKLTFAKGKLTAFAAPHVKPTARNNGCDNQSNSLSMTGATAAGPGKPKILNSIDTYVKPPAPGASLSWGNPRTSAYGDNATLSWLEKLKEIKTVKMQLAVGWTFPYQGYVGSCNSGPQNATIKLAK